MKLYDLEYFFIPQLVKLCNDKQLSPNCLTDLDFWKRFMENNEMTPEFNWDELSVEFQAIDDDKGIFFYIFPKPEHSPEAKYGAVIIDSKEQTFRYFTFEKEDENWCVGETTEQKHIAHGFFDKDAGLSDFINVILDITKK